MRKVKRTIMDLETKIELKKLAKRASDLYVEIFYAQDEDYVDRRSVTKKEIALSKIIKDISDKTNVSEDEIYKVVTFSISQTFKDYFNNLRAIGVPIATMEEIALK